MLYFSVSVFLSFYFLMCIGFFVGTVNFINGIQENTAP